MPELLPLKGGYYIWKYVPSTPATVIFLLLWIVASIFLSIRMFRTRTWFCIAFIIGCFMEFIGYSARASAANKTNKLMPYIIQSTYILLPPTLFAATIYVCLGRIIRLVGGDHLSIIRPQSITKIFVGGDLVSFLIQGASSGLSVMARTNPLYGRIGNGCVIAGLAIQLLSFCLFTVTAGLFHSRLRRSPRERSFQVDQSWIQTMHMLYGVSALILVRSVFRIIEYAMGSDGYLLTHEWTLYVFDSVPMLVVAGLFYWRFADNMVLEGGSDLELESQHSGVEMVPNKR